MSTISTGRLESVRVRETKSKSMTQVPAPVHAKTTSALASSVSSESKEHTRAPTFSARASPRDSVRFTTVIVATPARDKAVATPSPISPAPTTRTLLPVKEPRISSAISTAACETEAVDLLIPVSVRARFPTSRA